MCSILRCNFKRHRCAATLLSLIAILSTGAACLAHAADILEPLDKAQQETITRLCAPTQFLQGPKAYRECLLQRMETARTGTDVQLSALSDLALDEQHAIQRYCASSGPLNSPDNLQCTRTQLLELEKQPQPRLSTLEKHEQYVIAQQCSDSQTPDGVLNYRACVNSAIESLDSLPAAEFADTSASTRNNMQLECSLYAIDVGSYRRCLLNALGIAFVAEPTPDDTQPGSAAETTENDPAASTTLGVSGLTTNRENQSSTLNAQAASNQQNDAETASESVVALPGSENSDSLLSEDDDPAAALSAEDEALIPIADSLRQTPLQPVFSLSDMRTAHWIALASALMLALMVAGLLFARRKASRQTSAYADATSTHSRRDTHRSAPARPNLAAIHGTGMSQPHEIADVSDVERAVTADAQAMENTVPFRQSDTPGAGVAASGADEAPSARITDIPVPKDRGRFGTWLSTLADNEQQDHAIDLLIYWIAYADNRFDPAMRTQVFQMKEPDNQNLIKRWAFKQDPLALADAIQHLKANTHAGQRQQIICLLMALLVDEGALTPIQNNLLRFVADAFGINQTVFARMFLKAYGQRLPALPRPDKRIWWDKISAEQKMRWDARALVLQPEQIRHRVALGQPLQGALNQTSIEASYLRAMRRCAGDQASELGERERSLLDARRRKYEAAREALAESVT